MNEEQKQEKQASKKRPLVTVIPANADLAEERPKRRVAAYCRVSTGLDSQETSFELQVAYYRNYIRRNKSWSYAGVYADKGISGTSIKNRVEFQKMIEDCKAGKIDLIITKSISRFARNTLDCLNYVRLLKGLPSPVEIYFEKENIYTLDSKGELILTILSSLAQEESVSNSKNSQWAIQKRFQQGLPRCTTTTFLGYDKDKEGNFVINPEQAETVKRIFSEYLAGDGPQKIAKRLTADGVKTGKGNTKWHTNCVSSILKNEKYCGDLLLQKKVTVDVLTHKRVVNRGHLPKYYIADHHPAIVSREVWEQAQAITSRRRGIYHSKIEEEVEEEYRNRLIFSKTLYCRDCGTVFIRRRFRTLRDNKTFPYFAWKCKAADGRIEGKECGMISYPEESICHRFMAMLLEMKREQDEWIPNAQAFLTERGPDDWEKERIYFLQNRIRDLKEQLGHLARQEHSSWTNDLYDDMRLDLSQEIETFQNELDKLNEKGKAMEEVENELNWFLNELDGLTEFDPVKESIPFRGDIYKRVVERGSVYDDGSIDYELVFGVVWKSMDNRCRAWKLENQAKYKED